MSDPGRKVSVPPPSEGLKGWAWRAFVAGTAVVAGLDVLLLVSEDSRAGLATLLAVVAVGLLVATGLRAGGRHLSVFAGAAAGLSVLVSVGQALADRLVGRWASTDFGLAEGMGLTLLLVACVRRLKDHRFVVPVMLMVAVVALPFRLGWSSDVVTFVLAALVVAAVAVATGLVLRNADVANGHAVEAARRGEREEMARELHDVVAHHVTGMVVLVQAARAVGAGPTTMGPDGVGGPETRAQPIDDVLSSVERAGADALAALRSLVGVLRRVDPSDTEAHQAPSVGPEDLSAVVRRFHESGAAAQVHLVVGSSADQLPTPVQSAVHRIVQESLTNAARYAHGAAEVHVELVRTEDSVVLTVRDSGGLPSGDVRSTPGTGGGGFGLIGMRERVGVLNGSLQAGPSPGGGWLVRAEVPV